MIYQSEINSEGLKRKIKRGEIVLAVNSKLKIYGRLNCSSGKRMKRENRVFFGSTAEAAVAGFRPCGHCLAQEFKAWKRNSPGEWKTTISKAVKSIGC